MCNQKHNVTFCWLVVLIHWDMVLVRTNLNRECAVYPSGVSHSADTYLLDLVHDTPHFKSSFHTPYVKIGFPTPSIEIGFHKG